MQFSYESNMMADKKRYFLTWMLIFTILPGLLGQKNNKVDSLLLELSKVENSVSKVKIFNQLAWSLKSAYPDSSLAYATKARELAENIGDKPGLAEAIKNTGNIYHNKGNYLIATSFYEKALGIYTSIDDTTGRADCLNNLGNMSSNRADFTQAIEYFLKAAELYGLKKDTAKIGICYINMGIVYNRLKQYEKALAQLQKALEFSYVANKLSQISACYTNLGVVYNNKEQFDTAIYYLQKSLEIKLKLNEMQSVSTIYTNIGSIFYKSKKPDSAIYYFNKSLKIKKELSDNKGIASLYQSIAEMYIQEGNLNLALEFIKKSDLLIQNTSSRHLLPELYKMYSIIYQKKNNYTKAFDYLEKYSILNDSLMGNTVGLKIADMEKQFEIQKREMEISALKTENEFNARQMAKNKQILWLWILISILFTTISIFTLIAYRNNRNKNKILKQQNEEIKSQRDYISSQRDIIRKELTETILKSEILQRENLQYKLEALKNQLNPHFLFNTFSTLISLIPEDQKLAENYARNLSNVYRYILTMHDKELASIREELEFINAYMFMVTIRFDNRVSLNIDIDEELKVYYIPSFSLQLLVENAVKHNIITSKRPLKIVIENADRKICVKNNLQKKSSAENSTGIGLNNIIERYKFLCGELVEIICTENEFIVKLPILFEEKCDPDHKPKL